MTVRYGNINLRRDYLRRLIKSVFNQAIFYDFITLFY